MGFCPASQLDLTAGSIVTGNVRAIAASKYRYMIHPPEPLADIPVNELIYVGCLSFSDWELSIQNYPPTDHPSANACCQWVWFIPFCGDQIHSGPSLWIMYALRFCVSLVDANILLKPNITHHSEGNDLGWLRVFAAWTPHGSASHFATWQLQTGDIRYDLGMIWLLFLVAGMDPQLI